MARKRNLNFEKVLGVWQHFVKQVPKMSEEELNAAIAHEQANGKRPQYLFRMHRKVTRLRYKREQKEMGIVK